MSKEYQCNQCKHKKQADKYKRKYEIAKSGLTKEEREIIGDLICNEQIKHLLIKGQHSSERYIKLEQLKAKIKVV